MSPPVSQRIRASVPPRPSGPPPKKPSKWLGRILFWLAIVGVAAVAISLFVKFGVKAGPTLSFKRGDETYELLSPKMLGLVLLAPYFLFVTGRSLADLPWPQRVLSWMLRTAFVVLLAVGLGRVAKTAYSHKVCTVYVVDVSESVPQEAIADAQQAIDKAWNERGEGEVRVITFAVRPHVIGSTDPADPKAAPPKLERHDQNEGRVQGAGTNIQAALQLAYGLYPSGYLKRVVLYSDGVQTAGDALAEAGRAREFGVKLFTVPYKRPVPAEVAVRELRVPDKIKVGEPFEVHAILWTNRTMKVRARMYQGEALNGLDGIRDLDLKPGESDIAFKSVVRVPGSVTYALDVEPLGLSTGAPASASASASAPAPASASASASAAPMVAAAPPKAVSKPGLDRFVENNKYATTVAVPGRPSVLYVEGDQGHGSYLTNALVAQEFEVDLRGPDGIPTSLKEIERYDFVVLSDVSADRVSYAQQDLIESYVKDLGGGFLMAGGQNSFGLGGWRHTKIEKILPVRMDAEKKKDQPSIALCLVIDRSGSMSGQKIEMAKEAAKATAEVLSPDDYIEVIAFDSQPMRLVRMQSARNRMRILSDISRLAPNGGTDIFPAIQQANEDLSLVAAKRKHMILLSDGEAPIQGIKELVQEMVSEGMTASAVALGEDADKNLMKMVAETGGGRFYFVKDPNALPRIFTKETELVSKSSAVDEYFQPTVVGHADFLRGVDVEGSPYLHGFVATALKPPPAQLVLTPGDHEEPLLARWRVGLGWTLAWTSDVKNLWAAEWLRWAQYPQFWGQLVREHMRQKKRQQLDMKVDLVDGVVKASVDAIGGDDRFQNGYEGKVTIVGPAPKTDKVVVPLQQVAPGRYEARHVLDQFGSFVLQGELTTNGAPVAESFGHVSNPYPREYAAFEPDLSLMSRLATATGAGMDSPLAAVIDPAGEKISYHEDLWMRFVKWAILVFVIDLAMRRVRLFDRRFRAAT